MQRREFGSVLAAGLTAVARDVIAARPAAAAAGVDETAGSLTDVAGVKVGHFTDPRRPTGCTVVLTEGGAVCGVDVRGGAPGTRETDLLDPINVVDKVHAVVLSGGSAFGLEAATGVVRFLEEKGIGFPAGPVKVPIVPAAILFDLRLGDAKIRPDANAGYAAARAASTSEVLEGNVGAGAGATVGKLFDVDRAMKCGVGTASIRLPSGLVVAALVAVNAAGDVVDPASGRIVAGARTADGRGLAGTLKALVAGRPPGEPLRGENTTIGVIATNAALTKAETTKVAQMAHDGLARTIAPVHTPWDGDTLFALSLGAATPPGGVLVVGALAAEAVARAVLRAARTARGLPGLPAAADLG
jgi:L-aminopeptidase/D-esterase-like protein